MCDPQSTGWMADDISSRQPPLKKENCSLSLSHPITNQLPFSCDAKKKKKKQGEMKEILMLRTSADAAVPFSLGQTDDSQLSLLISD